MLLIPLPLPPLFIPTCLSLRLSYMSVSLSLSILSLAVSFSVSGPCLVNLEVSRFPTLPPAHPPSMDKHIGRGGRPSGGAAVSVPLPPPDQGSAIHRWMSFPFTLLLLAHLRGQTRKEGSWDSFRINTRVHLWVGVGYLSNILLWLSLLGMMYMTISQTYKH